MTKQKKSENEMEGVTDAWVNVDDDDKIIDSISEKEVEK